MVDEADRSDACPGSSAAVRERALSREVASVDEYQLLLRSLLVERFGPVPLARGDSESPKQPGRPIGSEQRPRPSPKRHRGTAGATGSPRKKQATS